MYPVRLLSSHPLPVWTPCAPRWPPGRPRGPWWPEWRLSTGAWGLVGMLVARYAKDSRVLVDCNPFWLLGPLGTPGSRSGFLCSSGLLLLRYIAIETISRGPPVRPLRRITLPRPSITWLPYLWPLNVVNLRVPHVVYNFLSRLPPNDNVPVFVFSW